MQRNLIYLLYRLLQAAAFPFLVVYLLVRGIREPSYFRRLEERFGILPSIDRETAHGAIWLHAVSVGEVLTSTGLLKKLRAAYPERRLFVSATTLAGRALAEEKLAGLADGVFYAPIDYCFAVRRVLRRLRPSLVIIAETEIWPNWYREIKRTGAGLLVVNGRISDRAYPRYRRLQWFFAAALGFPDAILTQNAVAADRFRELGAPADRVVDTGNLKYDFDPAAAAVPAPVADLLGRLEPRETWIAASTMPPAEAGDPDEDDVVIDAFREMAASREQLLLILVPRRPARFDTAAQKLEAAGIRFLRRSELHGGERLELPGVLLLDTIGELSGIFPLADVVFMGGTLARRGGHNILEPAFFGKPIVVGPHMENFADIAAEFRSGDGLVRVEDSGVLAGVVRSLLGDNARRAALGERARQLAEAKRGATARALDAVSRLSNHSVARTVRPLVVRALLTPLSWAWAAGAGWKRRRQTANQRKLSTPVVSIGGIGMGGAGKTPFALYLADRLSSAVGQAFPPAKNENTGQTESSAPPARPAILTRGYRRRSAEASTVLPAGSEADVALTGDEAQILLRSGLVHLGIGSDRYQTGLRVERELAPGVMILDDGFQHWRLARDLDIVLMDALDPFAGGALFPLGRLREPIEQLKRADAFVLTRCHPGAPLAGIETELRRYNPDAPIFRSRVVPLEWVDVESGETIPVERLSGKAAAFCGLANPQSFWRSLDQLGCRPFHRWTFSDHHRYTTAEIDSVAAEARAAQAEVLLTTEKDALNLPPGIGARIAPLRLLWLRIGVEVENEDELLQLIIGRWNAEAPIGQ